MIKDQTVLHHCDGANRARSRKEAIRGGYVNMLITNNECAESCYEKGVHLKMQGNFGVFIGYLCNCCLLFRLSEDIFR